MSLHFSNFSHSSSIFRAATHEEKYSVLKQLSLLDDDDDEDFFSEWQIKDKTEISIRI